MDDKRESSEGENINISKMKVTLTHHNRMHRKNHSTISTTRQ